MLPYSCIDSVMYDHEMNVYYSTQTQNSYGQIVRSWNYDRTERGIVKRSPKTTYDVGIQLNTWNDVLVGHSEEDLRIDSDGEVHPASEVLITFIIPAYTETAGPRAGLRTAYELRASTPVSGPFGEVLHFDIQLVRSVDQNVALEED